MLINDASIYYGIRVLVVSWVICWQSFMIMSTYNKYDSGRFVQKFHNSIDSHPHWVLLLERGCNRAFYLYIYTFIKLNASLAGSHADSHF